MLVFDGILTLAHNATSLILPGAANIPTAAGDTAILVSEGSGNWRCLAYNRAVAVPSGGVHRNDISLASARSFTSIPAGVNKMTLTVVNLSTNGTVSPVVQLGTSSGLQITSYTGKAVSMSATPSIVIATNSSGFLFGGGSWAAGVTITGTIEFQRLGPSSNVWIARGQIARTDTDQIQFVSGAITLAGALDRLEIVTSDTYDNGTAGLMYGF